LSPEYWAFLERYLPITVTDDGCGVDNLGVLEGHRAIRHYTVSILNHTLKGSAAAAAAITPDARPDLPPGEVTIRWDP
jgi:hypothetical protein